MTIKDAKELKIGDFVRIISTHKDRKTNNDECVWMVVGVYYGERTDRYPIMNIDIRLVKGSYKRYERNEIVNEGTIIRRTNKALKKVNIVSIEIEDA